MELINMLSEWTKVDPLIIAISIVWIFIWKGFALWKSAELHHKYWFLAILLINTFGILEIIYLFFVARKYKVEIVERNE